MSSNWPCIECGAVEMGHCGKVGCSAMEDQLAEKNLEIARLGREISDGVRERAEMKARADAIITKLVSEDDAYALELREALVGVVAVADRQTVEFDRARAVLAKGCK